MNYEIVEILKTWSTIKK